MKKAVEKLLDCYGAEMTLGGNGREYPVRAMLQPTFSKSMQNMEKSISALGVSSKSQYIYTGPAEPMPEEGWYVTRGNRCYRMRKVEVVYWKNAPAYCWGLCVEVGVEA